MKIFRKTKPKETEQPMLRITCAGLVSADHEIKVFGNVDKVDGFTYYRIIIDNKKTFTVSRFDGQKWRMVNGEETVLSEKLGKMIEQYDNLYTIVEIVKNMP